MNDLRSIGLENLNMKMSLGNYYVYIQVLSHSLSSLFAMGKVVHDLIKDEKSESQEKSDSIRD